MKEFFESELFEDIKKFFKDLAERVGNLSEPGRPVIIKAFAAIVGVLAALSIGMIILEGVQNSGEEPTVEAVDAEATTVSETTAAAPAEENLLSSILFCLDDEQSNIHLLFVLSLDSVEETAKIFFLDPELSCRVNETEGSMTYHLRNGGVSQLVLAVSEFTGTEISRYLVGDEKAFTNFARELGDLEIDVEQSISYTHSGLNYIIDEGNQILTPDVLLKYFLYLGSDTTANKEKLKEIISLFAQTLFDCENTQQAQDNFGNVIGYFETNISALDFSKNKSAIVNLAHGLALRLEVYNTFAEMDKLAVSVEEQE